jgi:hypothetical protein
LNSSSEDDDGASLEQKFPWHPAHAVKGVLRIWMARSCTFLVNQRSTGQELKKLWIFILKECWRVAGVHSQACVKKYE